MHKHQVNSMHKYNPSIHHRRSIRLKGYDYSRPGLYFITMCVQDRECLFGYIENKKMNLNDPGKMVVKWYYELENKFPDIKCHQMIVMPDHFHCILQIVVGADLRVCPDNVKNSNTDDIVNSDNENIANSDNNDIVNSNTDDIVNSNTDDIVNSKDIPVQIGSEIFQIVGADIFQIVGADTQVCPDDDDINNYTNIKEQSNGVRGEHKGSPLHRVVQWFKTMTTNEYIRGVKTKKWQSFRGKLWQRNYYEHIIRNKRSYQNISAYILNNPAKWAENQI